MTRATLEEIPDQVVDYFCSRDIAPLGAAPLDSLHNLSEDEADEHDDIDLGIEVDDETGQVSLAPHNGKAIYDETKFF